MVGKQSSQYRFQHAYSLPLAALLLTGVLTGCAARPPVAQQLPPPPDWVFYAESNYGFDHASECQPLDDTQLDNPAAVAQAEKLASWKAEQELRRRAKRRFRLREGSYVIEAVAAQSVQMGDKAYLCVLLKLVRNNQ